MTEMTELCHCGTQPLETRRLILRPFAVEDAEAMFRNWACSEAVTRYLTWPAHSSAEGTRGLLKSWVERYQDPAYYQWGIALKPENEVIGSISVVHLSEKTAAAELGWCLGENWWGQGIMPEAALAVRDYLFDRAGFHRIEAMHDANNPRSGRVMQKIGMRKEGVMRCCGRNNQGICDLVLYAILREDRDQNP